MSLQNRIENDGFAIVPPVVAPQDLENLHDDISRATLCRSRAGVRHALGFAPVAAFAQQPCMIGLVHDVMGTEAFPFRATLFDKSPQSNWLVVWHQDTALPLKVKINLPGWGPWSVKEGIQYAHAPAAALTQVLALRIHLDDSTAANGPLRVLPGTHRMGVLSDEAIHELAARVRPVDCIVPKGGIIAMRPLLVHASSKSQTQMPRRVLHIEYATSGSVRQPLVLAVA